MQTTIHSAVANDFADSEGSDQTVRISEGSDQTARMHRLIWASLSAYARSHVFALRGPDNLSALRRKDKPAHLYIHGCLSGCINVQACHRKPSGHFICLAPTRPRSKEMTFNMQNYCNFMILRIYGLICGHKKNSQFRNDTVIHIHLRSKTVQN